LMKMGLSHDDGAGFSQPRRHRGISGRDAVFLRVEAGAAGGWVTCHIEAIFYPDGDSVERRPARRVREAGGECFRFGQHTLAIQCEIYIAAGVAVGVGKRFVRLQNRLA
jgi:hypothetical protein